MRRAAAGRRPPGASADPRASVPLPPVRSLPPPPRRTLWLPPRYAVHKLEVRAVKTLRPQREAWAAAAAAAAGRLDGGVIDRAILTFDLDADLRGVFNWNVKQLFVYVTARYGTPDRPFNEVVVWDRVVNRTADARLRLTDAFNEYPLTDAGTGLRGVPVSLALNWDVMPITGVLGTTAVYSHTVRMPAQYCTDAECTPAPAPDGAAAGPPRRPGVDPRDAPLVAGGGGAPAPPGAAPPTLPPGAFEEVGVGADGGAAAAPKKRKKKAAAAAAATSDPETPAA